MHGTLDRVVCLECGARSTREALDERLRAANPDLDWDEVGSSNPDGDAELADAHVARFRLVGCECCGGDLLKPDVVFFGESVPRPGVQRCFDVVDGSACLLVLGSSLTVMSGLRFVYRARQAQIPVAMSTEASSGDPLADVRSTLPRRVLPRGVVVLHDSDDKSVEALRELVGRNDGMYCQHVANGATSRPTH